MTFQNNVVGGVVMLSNFWTLEERDCICFGGHGFTMNMYYYSFAFNVFYFKPYQTLI